MKQTAVVIAPGRGTYNKAELGYLARHHSDRAGLISEFDAFRATQGQESLSALDGAARFSGAKHTSGDNASGLIHACAYADFLAIDRDRYDIIAVTGNSMGWYIALTCAGAVTPLGGFEIVNTMGTLMHQRGEGGQLIYPITDENWQEVPGRRATVLETVAAINHRADHALHLSIDLGGMLVLAGDDAGIAAFERAMPAVGRFPLRLPNHAAFHTEMMEAVAAEGRARLGVKMFDQPNLPLIDGRGAIWWPGATDTAVIHGYTLGHQVTQAYDFTLAIRVAMREFMPDALIVLGPGETLGGAVAQSMIAANWRGIDSKAAFQTAQAATPRLLSMGRADQRPHVTG